jgi:hypothetical protein
MNIKHIAAIVAVLASYSGAAMAQSVLPPAVDAFIASVNGLSTSAKDLTDLGRSAARLQLFKTEVSRQLLSANGESVVQLAWIDEARVLCTVESDNIVLAAERNYLAAVGSKIEEIGKPSQIDNLTSAVHALFASQSIDVQSVADETALKNLQKGIIDRCTSDLKSYDIAYYGISLSQPTSQLGNEAVGLSLLGSIGSLIDTIVGVVAPVIQEGAKIVDEQARRRVVLAFLSNPQNVAQIKNAGLDVARKTSQYVLTKRRALAGSFEQDLAVVRTRLVELKKLDACQAYLKSESKLARRQDGPINDDFVLCWKATWDAFANDVAAALKDADEYDRLADAGDSDNATKAFVPLSQSLQAVANTDNASIAQFWNWATELLAFADKVNTAASPENRREIQQAIDALVRGH